MKNIIQITVLFLAAIIATNTLYSQKLYVNAGSGYGFNFNGNTMGTSSTKYTYEADTSYSNTNYQNYKVSLGNGNIPEIGIGYQYSENWAIELNTFYLIGKPQNINYKTSYKVGGFTNTYEQVSSYSGNSFMLSPSVVYKSNRDKDLEFYTKIGLLIGKTKINLVNDIVVSEGINGGFDPFYNIVYNWEYIGGMSIGGQFGLGMEYNFIDNLCLFTELNYTSYSTKPSTGILLSYTVREEDKFDELTLSEKEVEFVEEYSETELSDNKANKLLSTRYSFNMIRFNIGLRWRINAE